MNILEKLAEIANDLDKKGLYSEASEIDSIIREAEGFREQLAPGLMGPADPSKMPPGAGAGGLPAAQDYTPESGDDFGSGHEGPGVSGKGKKRFQRGPKVRAFQQQYNDVWDKLMGLGIYTPALGRRLQVDGIRGPKTMRAERLFPRLQAILKNELSKVAPVSKPGVGVMPATKPIPEVKYPEKKEQPAWGYSDEDYPVAGPWNSQ